MGAMASKITSVSIVSSTVYWGADQRKHQSSGSLVFVRRIHHPPVGSPHKGSVTRKMFPFDDVIMRKCTPLWKSNRNFFSTQFFYHLFFVVCSSFYTWYMWGGQYQLCKFLLDFDHWLCLSDILKKVTGSKPDVALVWFMQWAKMELEHGEKDRYWCIVRV